MLASQCCVHIEVGNFNQYLSVSGGETLRVLVISILFICVLWSHVKEMALKRLWSGSRGSMADDGSESKKKNLNKKNKEYCTFILPVLAGSRPLLACFLELFKAYENRFIHITQPDMVESVADYAAHPRALQSTYCDCISN